MPIYLDYAELDRQIADTIEFQVIEPKVQVFGGSTIRSLNEAMSLKPEAVCQECGNAAATHRWNGATLLCPGPVSRGMQLAEQYLNENIDDYVRTLPAVQTLIAAMAQCLDRDDRRAADVLSRRILKLQYDYERSRNTIDKRIGLDSYESYMRMRGRKFSMPAAEDQRELQESLNYLNNIQAEAAMLSTKPPPDFEAIQESLDGMVDKTRKMRKPMKKPVDAPVLERPKRSYGDDY